MNIEEVLNYQPTTNIGQDNETDVPVANKKRRLNLTTVSGSLSSSGNNKIDIEKLMQPGPSSGPSSSSSSSNELDETTLKRLILQLERRILKNQEMRIKYADEPAKFMDSEIELFDIIKEMHIVATEPALYQILITMNILPQLLGLLTHDNTDIACALVALLQELTELDDVDELDEVGALMDSLLNNQIIVLLVNNMERLDENIKEESEAIYNSLAIVENLTDYKPELSKDCRPLIQWILRKLKSKPIFYPNKLYASEILSILLQNSEDNRNIVGTLNGIDILLHVVSYYKRHDPQTADEEEFMENIFNCLCSSLFMCRRNRELFYKAEGLELMVLILKEKRQKESNTNVRLGALKLLSHCFTTANEDISSGNPGTNSDATSDQSSFITALSDKLVDILGLRVLMPIFVKPGSILGHRSKRKQTLLDQIEEHSLSIILCLIRFCRPPARQRVINKFLENGAVKTERLVELHLKYFERLKECDDQIRMERNRRLQIRKQQHKLLDKEQLEEEENEFFLKRLNEGGLFQLQLIDQIMVLLSSPSDNHHSDSNHCIIKDKIIKLLNMHSGRLISGNQNSTGSSGRSSTNHIQIIKQILKEFCQEKQPDDQPEQEQDQYTKHLLNLIENF